MRTNSPQKPAVSLIEVLVVISILVLILAMLIPGMSRAREQARRVICAHNLRQWGIATELYRQDYDDYLPTEGTYLERRYLSRTQPYWFNVLPPYLNAPPYREVERVGKQIREFPELHFWLCPSKTRSPWYKSESGKNQFHYAMNYILDGFGKKYAPFPDKGERPISARRFREKPLTVLMFDIFYNSPNGAHYDVAKATRYHRDFANVLRIEGSVAGFSALDFVEDGDPKNLVDEGDLTDLVENGDLEVLKPIWRHADLYWGYIPEEAETGY